VTVFNRRNASGAEPQVVARKLIDEHGKPLATATILEMQQVVSRDGKQTAVQVPRRIEFQYHPDELHLRMTLDTVTVNEPIDPGYAQMTFARPNIQGAQPFDLARAASDSGYPRNDVRPIGARFRGAQK
jgi:hypothetical protein